MILSLALIIEEHGQNRTAKKKRKENKEKDKSINCMSIGCVQRARLSKNRLQKIRCNLISKTVHWLQLPSHSRQQQKKTELNLNLYDMCKNAHTN